MNRSLPALLTKIGHADDVPRDFDGHMIRFSGGDAYKHVHSTKCSIQDFWHANYSDGTFFKDKIVVVGASAQISHDVVDTPMSPGHVGPGASFTGNGRSA